MAAMFGEGILIHRNFESHAAAQNQKRLTEELARPSYKASCRNR
jgi:hypothetical protein